MKKMLAIGVACLVSAIVANANDREQFSVGALTVEKSITLDSGAVINGGSINVTNSTGTLRLSGNLQVTNTLTVGGATVVSNGVTVTSGGVTVRGNAGKSLVITNSFPGFTNVMYFCDGVLTNVIRPTLP